MGFDSSDYYFLNDPGFYSSLISDDAFNLIRKKEEGILGKRIKKKRESIKKNT